MKLLITAIRWVAHNLLPGFAVFAGLFFVLALAGEGYLRATKPFVEPQWISRFDPELGFMFVPGAIIRHTNHIDFWAEQRANSWGFLDTDPPAGDSKNCRIVFVGDSFVEAAQVPIERKFHRLFEAEWNLSNADLSVETLALGFSGTGQANQLPWAKLIQPTRPRLIVLVFVSNDFANNNAWLEAARNGWHPEHAPRMFVKAGVTLPPDRAWRQKLLPGQTGSGQAAWSNNTVGFAGWIHRKLYQKSYLYTALNRLWIHTCYSASAYYANVPAAVEELKKFPGGKEAFGDWSPPHDLTLDQMFMAEKVPPVFVEALDDTRQAIRLWKKEANAMGASLAILATHTLKVPAAISDEAAAAKRTLVPNLLFQRLSSIGVEEGIPVIDQAEYISRRGGNLKETSFTFDGHWNEYGHQSAAGAMLEWLLNHPGVCEQSFQK